MFPTSAVMRIVQDLYRTDQSHEACTTVDHTAPTRQHHVDHADHIDHVHPGYICPEISTNISIVDHEIVVYGDLTCPKLETSKLLPQNKTPIVIRSMLIGANFRC